MKLTNKILIGTLAVWLMFVLMGLMSIAGL